MCLKTHSQSAMPVDMCEASTSILLHQKQGKLHCRAKINSKFLVVAGFLCDKRWTAPVHDKIYSLYIQHFPIGTPNKTLGTNAGIPAKCKKGSFLIHKVLELITVVCKRACLEILYDV
jgi:hypothetical protein